MATIQSIRDLAKDTRPNGLVYYRTEPPPTALDDDGPVLLCGCPERRMTQLRNVYASWRPLKDFIDAWDANAPLDEIESLIERLRPS